jgi:uncharacterized protein
MSKQRLREIVQETDWLWRALNAVRDIDPPCWCIGAGAIRNAVWDALHSRSTPSFLEDIDVAYFDRTELSAERDEQYRLALLKQEPDLPWEVTNQAGVHLWFETVFGHAVGPLESIEEAVASWPETATSIGVRLDRDDHLQIIAPLGLDDLFGMVVRRNPRRVSLEVYRKRIETKKYLERWPNATVVAA